MQFVKSPLDEGWITEEDENSKLVYHFKPDNVTTAIHPHINRLKSTLYYLRSQIDDSERKEAQEQRAKDMELLHELKTVMKEAERAAAEKKSRAMKTLKPIRNLNSKSRKTLTTLDKPKDVKAPKKDIPGTLTNLQKDETGKDIKAVFYLLNDPNYELDPLPTPSSKNLLTLRHEPDRRDQNCQVQHYHG